tara:strand:- start:1554 stop:3527 length:1974 start_codon:yes stop_codon:yes gene_type:complete
MISLFGSSLISLALFLTFVSLGFNIWYIISKDFRFFNSGRNAIISSCILVILSGLTLVYALFHSDLSLIYVNKYSSIYTPTIFKISGFWAGMEGSLLFWTFILAIYTLIVLYQNRIKFITLMPWVTIVISIILIFFLFICLAFENPFTPVDGPIKMGSGLNPLLQHWAMLLHPPMLYLGFIGFTIPYAYAIAAMATQQLDTSWIRLTRRWSLFTWLLLSVAVVMGGKWAYMELGWGGYWAWDPVENASLFPWLTGTAFIHSIIIQEKKNMLVRWNMILIMVTFTLTIFGTYLTRSGIVSSVHAFAATDLGIWFFGFVVFLVILNIILLIVRHKDLNSQNQLDSFASREAGFVFNNMIFVAMMLVVLWGTLYPVMTEALRGVQIKLGPTWFNQKIIPFGFVLLVLMGIAPLLAWRKTSINSIKRNFLLPVCLSTFSGIIFYYFGITKIYPLITLILIIFVFITIIFEFYRGTRARKRGSNESWLLALRMIIEKNKSRYGGYIVHIGILMMFFGFIGKAYDKEADVSLTPENPKTELNEYSFELKNYWKETPKTNPNTRQNHHAYIAEIKIEKDDKYYTSLFPEKRIYTDQNSQPHSEVALNTTLNKDLYLILGSMDLDTGLATLKIRINHLVSWVWLGTLVLIIGTIIALIPSKKINE